MNQKSYTNWDEWSDKSLSEHIGAYVKHHRLDQNKTQEELAYAAGIGRSTLSLLERGQSVTLSTFIQVLRVLDLLPVMEAFKIDISMSPMALAKLEQEKRLRSRPIKKLTKNRKTSANKKATSK
jgi:transcriptional regulator with XRE-family HTH domain